MDFRKHGFHDSRDDNRDARSTDRKCTGLSGRGDIGTAVPIFGPCESLKSFCKPLHLRTVYLNDRWSKFYLGTKQFCDRALMVHSKHHFVAKLLWNQFGVLRRRYQSGREVREV
jgi:hypothetical protein